jgi:hypothetical protein
MALVNPLPYLHGAPVQGDPVSIGRKKPTGFDDSAPIRLAHGRGRKSHTE